MWGVHLSQPATATGKSRSSSSRASSSSATPLQRGTGAAGGVGDAELPGEGRSVARAVWDTGRKRDLGCRETGMGLGSPGAPVPVPCVVLERWRGRTEQQRFANRPLSRGTAETVLGLPNSERALMLHLAGLRDPTASPKATGERAQWEANPWWSEPLNDASKEKCRPTCKNETILPPTM